MTFLVCSGPLFTQWQHILEVPLLADTRNHPVYPQLSRLNSDICQYHSPSSNELTWKAVAPDDVHRATAKRLLASVEGERLFAWADNNSSLCLEFWRSVLHKTKFLLFYSNPEFELANLLQNASVDTDLMERGLSAWVIRTQAMLEFECKNHQDCLLVNAQSAISNAPALIESLNEKFGLDVEVPSGDYEKITGPDALSDYLANAYLMDRHGELELFNKALSAATALNNGDTGVPNMRERNKNLMAECLAAISCIRQEAKVNLEEGDKLKLAKLQLCQMREELAYYFSYYLENTETNEKLSHYIRDKQMMKLLRHARISQSEKATH